MICIYQNSVIKKNEGEYKKKIAYKRHVGKLTVTLAAY